MDDIKEKDPLAITVGRPPRNADEAFRGGMEILHQVLTAAKYNGQWSVSFKEMRCKRDEGKFHFVRRENDRSLLVRTKPGKPITGWNVVLTYPKKYKVDDIIACLRRIDENTLILNPIPKLEPDSMLKTIVKQPPAEPNGNGQAEKAALIKESLSEVEQEVQRKLRLPRMTEAELKEITKDMSVNVLKEWIIEQFQDKLVCFTFSDEKLSVRSVEDLDKPSALVNFIVNTAREKTLVDFIWGFAETQLPEVAEFRAKARADFAAKNDPPKPQEAPKSSPLHLWPIFQDQADIPLQENQAALDRALIAFAGAMTPPANYIGIKDAMQLLEKNMDWAGFLVRQRRYHSCRTIGASLFKGLCAKNYLHRHLSVKQTPGAQSRTRGFELLQDGATRIRLLVENNSDFRSAKVTPPAVREPEPLAVKEPLKPEPDQQQDILAKIKNNPEVLKLAALIDQIEASIKTYDEMMVEINTSLDNKKATVKGLQLGIAQLEKELKANQEHLVRVNVELGSHEKDLAEAENVRKNEVLLLEDTKAQIKAILET